MMDIDTANSLKSDVSHLHAIARTLPSEPRAALRAVADRMWETVKLAQTKFEIEDHAA